MTVQAPVWLPGPGFSYLCQTFDDLNSGVPCFRKIEAFEADWKAAPYSRAKPKHPAACRRGSRIRRRDPGGEPEDPPFWRQGHPPGRDHLRRGTPRGAIPNDGRLGGRSRNRVSPSLRFPNP